MGPGVSAGTGGAARIWQLDAARGAAMWAMAGYHLSWDLSFTGLLYVPLFEHWFWIGARLVIPAAFLFIVGVSMVLAHGPVVRWRVVARRVALVGGSAALVSAVTYVAFGQTYIFFGVLHCIAVMSVLGLPALRWPWWLSAALGLVIIALPSYWSGLLFDAPWLQWVGLGTYFPNTNDYVPIFPWGGLVLVGIAAGRIFRKRNIFPAPTQTAPRWAGAVCWSGRHALPFYLLHQPLLLGCVVAIAWLMQQ
jgi:uncharacterized membrane protein